MQQELYHDLIQALLSNDNRIRQQAEEKYKEFQTQNESQVMVELLHLLGQDGTAEIRALSAVLLKRLIRTCSRWTTMQPEMKNGGMYWYIPLAMHDTLTFPSQNGSVAPCHGRNAASYSTQNWSSDCRIGCFD